MRFFMRECPRFLWLSGIFLKKNSDHLALRCLSYNIVVAYGDWLVAITSAKKQLMYLVRKLDAGWLGCRGVLGGWRLKVVSV